MRIPSWVSEMFGKGAGQDCESTAKEHSHKLPVDIQVGDMILFNGRGWMEVMTMTTLEKGFGPYPDHSVVVGCRDEFGQHCAGVLHVGQRCAVIVPSGD